MKTPIFLFQLFLIKGSMKEVIQVQNGKKKTKPARTITLRLNLKIKNLLIL